MNRKTKTAQAIIRGQRAEVREQESAVNLMLDLAQVQKVVF
ncbi:MAG: hypothetical protein R6X11_00740 [Desulfonatronovibrio sp.]